MTRLSCQNISKTYKNFSLNHVSFTIESGYITALIGKNGSGKTTLLSCLSNAIQKFTGDIFLDQINQKEHLIDYKQQIAFISESARYFMEKSILENGELLGTFYKNWSWETFYTYLDQMNLSPAKKLCELSRGQYMAFQNSFSLAHHPKFLFLDEPAAGFDPVFRKDYFKLIQKLRDDDIGILISSHIIQDLETLADYILVLENGNLIPKDTTKKIEPFSVDNYSIRDLL